MEAQLPERWRQRCVISYDCTSFPFRRAVMECLGLASAQDDHAQMLALDAMRKLEGRASSAAARAHGSGSAYWYKRWHSKEADLRDAQRAFDSIYIRFLREIVLPHFSDPTGILFQRRPTFRCHIPPEEGELCGNVHRDADYGHQTAETNWWLPITNTSSANTLMAESAPGLGDFSPFVLDYGGVVRFWGAQCAHYTVARAGAPTRVSIDFRVVPRSCHAEVTKGDSLGSKKRGRGNHAIGGFYSWMGPDGVLLSESSDAPASRSET
jgi:hypothetical protein